MTKNNNFSFFFSVSLMALYTHFFRFRMELSMWFVERWLYTCWTLLGEFYFIFFSSMKAWFGYVTRGKRFLRCELLSGWSIISDPWEFRAFGNDGEGVWTSAGAYDSKGWVSSQILYHLPPWWMLHIQFDMFCTYKPFLMIYKCISTKVPCTDWEIVMYQCYFVSTSPIWWFINAFPLRSLSLTEK